MRVQIRLANALGPRFAAAFHDLDVRTETVLSGTITDQAALHGVLARLRDLNLDMVDVRVEEDRVVARAGDALTTSSETVLRSRARGVT